MKVEFSTTEYQFSHGKMPRGEGSWAFFFGTRHDTFNKAFRVGAQSAPGTLSCGAAKQWASKRAKAQGIIFVSVAP